MSRPTINFLIIDEPAKLKVIEQDWYRLFTESSNDNYFLTFDWNWYAWQHIEQQRKFSLRILVGRCQGKIILIWPLVLSSVVRIRELRWLGSGYGDCRDVLVERSCNSKEWVAQAWRFIQNNVPSDLISLNGITVEGQIKTIVGKDAFQGKTQVAPYINWRQWPSWNQYQTIWKGKFRRDSQRQRRRLARCGEINFKLAGNEQDSIDTIHWMIKAKERWLKIAGKRDYPWKHHPQYQTFLNCVAIRALKNNQLFLGTLMCDDVIVAASMGFHTQGCFRFWKYAYDTQWSQYSPGTLAFIETLRWSFESGHKIFDLMPYSYPYKYNYTNTDQNQYHYLIPRTFVGRLYITVRQTKYFPRLRSSYYLLRNLLR